MLNPDSKSLVENQDLCLGFFFSITKHLFLFVRTKNIIGLWNSLLFIIRFVIYKRTQYTYLQNGPFDAIRFSWQANYRKQGFLQTVRVFDLRVMELRVELRLSFFLFYSTLFGRDWGKIDDGLLLLFSSSWWCVYTNTHLSYHQNNSSVNKTVVQASNLSEKLSKAAVTAATTAALFASVRFFFLCFLVLFWGWF